MKAQNTSPAQARRSLRRLIKPFTFLALSLVFLLFLTIPASAALPSGEDDSIFDTIDPIDPQLEDSPLLDAGGGTGSEDPNISISLNGESSDAVNIVILLTILTILPSLLIMMTCFTRIIIIFSLLRNAIGLQQTPPNQVLVGLALFLTVFIMRPVLTDIYDNAYQPMQNEEIGVTEFMDRAKVPLRQFMLDQTQASDINLFLNLAELDQPSRVEDYPMTVVIPAFITSEVKRAFTTGFMLFIPFLIIDMVVASALMSMGMMMLPPVTVSLPFKLMLFVLVDGWGLLIKTLVMSYNL